MSEVLRCSPSRLTSRDDGNVERLQKSVRLMARGFDTSADVASLSVAAYGCLHSRPGVIPRNEVEYARTTGWPATSVSWRERRIWMRRGLNTKNRPPCNTRLGSALKSSEPSTSASRHSVSSWYADLKRSRRVEKSIESGERWKRMDGRRR